MNTQNPTDPPKYKVDLTGQIANLAMRPSYANTLIPLYEAVMNSLHSVQDRFGDNWREKCQIEVQVLQDLQHNTHSFKILDNGIGLTEKNFDSFCTYDSRLKVSRGGKGVGRLTWLKVFEEVDVSSVFFDNEQKRNRSFKFLLDNEVAFQEHQIIRESEETKIQTCIALRYLKNGYQNFCPKRLETIANRISAHFLPFFIGSVNPNLIVRTCTEEINLADLVAKHINLVDSNTIELENIGSMEINHLYVDKTLIEKGTQHTVYLTANDRIVKEHGINNQIGLDTHIDYNDVQAYYVGLVSSKFLDDNVTQERNNFDITSDDYKSITKKAEVAAIEILHDPINSLLASKAEKINEVVINFPRFSYLVNDRYDFAKNMPPQQKV